MAISSFGGIPNAEMVKQRVYYTESSTIYEGMPVCYEFDATTNWLGVDSGDSDVFGANPTRDPYLDTSTAEGYHNEGKLIRVEDPDDDNIHAIAGFVIGQHNVNKTGPCTIDIAVSNGAVIPVRTDLNCTVGRTVLAIHTGEQMLTSPHETAGRPVAVAWETVDRSETTGLVFAKVDPNMFIWQQGDASSLLIDDQDTTSPLKLNKIYASTAQTGGRFMAFDVQVTITGTPANTGYGYCLYTQLDVSGIMTGQNAGNSFWTNFNSGGDISGDYYGVEIGIYESGADLSGLSGSDTIAPLCLRYQLDATNGPGANCQWMMYLRAEGDGGDTPDGLFACYSSAAINMNAQSAASVSHVIPIKMVATESGGAAAGIYYIMVSDAA